ncbi:hypothetical protein CHS0354_005893 [Potamilus streckersoni]|uniref:Uncharacterized protein n=1 Tax=Potamilus streckersoni TaxID=2493646 RepID=A0AAE0T883_9BIVA|nr:hypothetical protein CHS0354_005893 [Potamilus streckersoni]
MAKWQYVSGSLPGCRKDLLVSVTRLSKRPTGQRNQAVEMTYWSTLPGCRKDLLASVTRLSKRPTGQRYQAVENTYWSALPGCRNDLLVSVTRLSKAPTGQRYQAIEKTYWPALPGPSPTPPTQRRIGLKTAPSSTTQNEGHTPKQTPSTPDRSSPGRQQPSPQSQRRKNPEPNRRRRPLEGEHPTNPRQRHIVLLHQSSKSLKRPCYP